MIYANCLNEDFKNLYFAKWGSYDYVELFDNTQHADSLKLKAGETITSPEGITRVRDAACENYDELWTRELPKIRTRYFATVDADFEILKPEFVSIMIKELENNPKVVAMSTDYTPAKQNHFDSYSNEVINLNQRWNTWFCIYKQAAQVCKVSHFYYETDMPDGKRRVYDSAGYFQNSLIEDFGYVISVLSEKYQNQFIHYGAFSKNRSLNEKNIKIYRILSIFKKIGLIDTNLHFFDRIINEFFKKVAYKCFERYYKHIEKERRVYNFE